MPRLRTRQVATSRRRPNRAWGGFANTVNVGIPAATKVLLGGFTLSNANIDETVLRTVGTLSVASDQVAVSEQQLGAFGLIIVNDLAVAAGAASIPGPITDRESDGWFLYVPIVQQFNFASGVGLQPDMAVQYHFDSKAKRRVQEGFQIAIMVENAHATHGFAISTIFRMLTQITGT